MSVLDQSALLTWEVGDPGSTCVLFYQLSEDGGGKWSQAQPIMENLIGCPQEMRLIHGNEGLTYMIANLQEQVYLLAWNGKRWSTPQPQLTLNSFIDEGTYNTVYLRCRNFAYLPEKGSLLVVGCDSGSGGDIWLTSRPMGGPSDWYTAEPAWMQSSLIYSGSGSIQSPLIIADPVKGMHVFWSQTDSTVSISGETGNNLITTIYYAFWDGEHWLVPGTALATSAGKAIRPAVTLDPGGRLMVVWNTNQTGEINFSWASASRALSSSEWATPLLLPLPHPLVSSPDILADAAGIVYVAYAVPLNEGRGIYIISSTDLGKTWSAPVMVFDGAAAGWEMIDQPHLAVTGDGRLHLLWTKLTVPAGNGVLGLYYASSEDGGKIWSEAKEVVDKPVTWDEIVASGESTLHRFWQEGSSGSMMIWQDQSLDGGSTWEKPEIVSSFLGTTGLSSIAVDASGQLHLLQMVEKGQEEFTLQHSIWNGANWTTFENAGTRKGQSGQRKLFICSNLPFRKYGRSFRRPEERSGLWAATGCFILHRAQADRLDWAGPIQAYVDSAADRHLRSNHDFHATAHPDSRSGQPGSQADRTKLFTPRERLRGGNPGGRPGRGRDCPFHNLSSHV